MYRWRSFGVKPKRPKPAREHGFTLLEVLVALAIAALALGSLAAAASTGIGNARLADQYIEATRRAQSHLALIGTAMRLEGGEQYGDDGDGYAWRVRISPSASMGVQAAGQQPATVYSCEVIISWNFGGVAKSVSILTLRAGRAEASDG